jgi:hypothetical protein
LKQFEGIGVMHPPQERKLSITKSKSSIKGEKIHSNERKIRRNADLN